MEDDLLEELMVSCTCAKFRFEIKISKSHEAQFPGIHIWRLHSSVAFLTTGAQEMPRSRSQMFNFTCYLLSSLW